MTWVQNADHPRWLIYKEQKKWDLALTDYNKAMQINPKDADAYNNRGTLYYEQKKWDKALVDYNKAIQINPSFALAYPVFLSFLYSCCELSHFSFELR